MMWRLRKFISLSPSDRGLLVQAFILLGFVKLGLWLLSFRVLQRSLASASQVASSKLTVEFSQIVMAVNVSSRYMPGGAKCLARALTTQVLMRRNGYSPQLRIGVAKGAEGQFQAHAWVEDQGQVIIGQLQDLSRFIPLPLSEEM